ncbi:DUF3140 domain-containing protein [Planosporangium flavigriseum]|uniref:DUF3140 domain-containing protein n=1 Tax=Planosporangium flavigriseum TaxID=373681 RepID=A0A8J3LVR9_9ACTN|nr:DUF3140 domain-containing protein [Planosporangium flavigriseum]NJC66394.1 DUF3140 domain-containing protein [Planosporangium flavigriseum]GIG74200.1 hypothetical protein Pfl04_26040 [Planosporangium flavigriseum]
MTRSNPAIEQRWDVFHRVVNMPSPELRDWLLSTPDGAAAYAPEPDIDIHELGGRVLRILEKRRVDLTDDDVATMELVTELVVGRLMNAPPEEAVNEPWRDTLLTLGHDPLRPDSPRGEEAATLLREMTTT